MPLPPMNTQALQQWVDKVRRDILGVRFSVNVFIASSVVWYVLVHIADTNPIWAIASMIAASDPQVEEAARMFRSRLINVLVGCVVGLTFLAVGDPSEWKGPDFSRRPSSTAPRPASR